MNNCYLSDARISLVARKSVFIVTDQIGHQTACLARRFKLLIMKHEVSFYLGNSKGADQIDNEHVDLHLSHSHMQDTLVLSEPDSDRNADSINNISRFS